MYRIDRSSDRTTTTLLGVPDSAILADRSRRPESSARSQRLKNAAGQSGLLSSKSPSAIPSVASRFMGVLVDMAEMNHRPGRVAAYVLSITLVPALWLSSASAGMPGVLPGSWTAENPDMAATDSESVGVAPMRPQAISFFVAGFLLSAWLVMRLWNAVRRDFPALPSMTYPRSPGVLTLWGLAFIVVLTMISGARELMTPGAWRQQG